MSVRLAVSLTVLLAVVVSAPGQAPSASGPPTEAQAFDKERARARYELSRASPADLLEARRDALRAELTTRIREFLAGRSLFDALIQAETNLARAEQELAPSPAGRRAALEALWAFTWEAYRLNRAGYEAGRVKPADYFRARAVRLGAEARLAAAAPAQGGPAVLRFGPGGQALFEDGDELLALARGRFEASQARLADLRRARRDALAEAFRARFEDFLAGRGSLDLLLKVGAELAEAEQILSGPGERPLAVEERWLFSWVIDRLCRASYEAGRTRHADSLEALAGRLRAELRLVEAGPSRSSPACLPVALTPDLEAGSRDLARARYEVSRARASDLRRARVEALRTARDEWEEEFLEGRLSLNSFQESCGAAVEAELAADRRLSRRVAVLEEAWRLAWEAERLIVAGHEAGRVLATDFHQARARRLAAELRLLEALALRKK